MSTGIEGPTDTRTEFRTLFEAVPGAYLVLCPDAPRFTIVAATDAYLRVTFTRRDEIVGRGLFEVFPENQNAPAADGVGQLREALKRVVATGLPDTMPVYEYDIENPEGEYEERFWSRMISPAFDAEGSLRWLMLWEEDVTALLREKHEASVQTQVAEALRARAGEMEKELHRARQLRAANARLRKMKVRNDQARERAEAAERKATRILESITEAFAAVDDGWRFTYVNQRAEQLLGRTRAELIGQEVWLDHPQDSAIGRALLQAMAEQRSTVVKAFSKFLGRWLEVHASPSPEGLSIFVRDVTDRHVAQEALRESERRFRSLFDESIDGVLLTRPDGTIQLANRASTRLFGYSEAELQALGRQAVMIPGDPRTEAFFANRRRTGSARAELQLKRKDGVRIPVELSSASFHDERGGEWTSLFVRDISERKAREAERERLVARLQEERRWLRAVLDTSPVGLLLFEPDDRMYFNAAAEQLFGEKLSTNGGRAQFAGKVFYPDGTPVPFFELASSRALERGESVVSEPFYFEPAPGKRVPVLCSAAPIRDGEKKRGAVVVLQEVSERQRAEEEIRANERLLSGLFEILPVGLWMVDADGRLVRSNEAIRAIWDGWRYEGLSDLSNYEATWAETNEPVKADDWALARALKKKETSLNELLCIRTFAGDAKTILNSTLPLTDANGRLAGAVVMNQDITQLKKVEAALREAIRAREEILGVVAHDLRNPLGSIRLQAEAIARRPDDAKRRGKGLEAIQRLVKRMKRLIQDLLDVSQVESGTISLDLVPLSAEALLGEVFEEQRSLASASSLRLHLGIANHLPNVLADHDRLLQIFENLVGNAMKFTNAGGHITLGARAQGSDVLFWVADTGQGIAANEVSHLFDPFWQANRNDQRGVGLGLPIVKGLVEASGGRVWVESRQGQGSTFFFTLPVALEGSAERGADFRPS